MLSHFTRMELEEGMEAASATGPQTTPGDPRGEHWPPLPDSVQGQAGSRSLQLTDNTPSMPVSALGGDPGDSPGRLETCDCSLPGRAWGHPVQLRHPPPPSMCTTLGPPAGSSLSASQGFPPAGPEGPLPTLGDLDTGPLSPEGRHCLPLGGLRASRCARWGGPGPQHESGRAYARSHQP